MKKKIKVLMMTFLLAVSSVLPVCAAEAVESTPYTVTADMTCINNFNSARSVTAGTAMDGQIVSIISKAYNTNENNIGSGGNTGRSSTTTTYSTSDDIYYVINTYSAPEVGMSLTRKIFR